ncbi:MAG: L,D-transpeptidase [Geminicoccales bacterium]
MEPLDARAARKFNFTSQQRKLDRKFERQEVNFSSDEKPGTIIISTRKRFLWLVLDDGKVLRYGIGVGREGFQCKGSETISRKAAWPSWRPPKEMLEREPDLPTIMPGGPENHLGAGSTCRTGRHAAGEIFGIP